MKNSKKSLIILLLLLVTFGPIAQIKVTFKNKETLTVSKIAFTKGDVLMDLTPNNITQYDKQEIVSVNFLDGRIYSGFVLSEMVSSEYEIKAIGYISNLNIDNKYLPIKYEGVVSVPNIDKKNIYLRSRIWFHKSFVDDKAVLSIQDLENGVLVGNGIFKVYKTLSGYLKFNIRIYIKDNKYKYIMDGLIHDDLYIKQGTTTNEGMGLLTTNQYSQSIIWGVSASSEKIWKQLKNDVDISIKSLVDSLKNTVLNDHESDF